MRQTVKFLHALDVAKARFWPDLERTSQDGHVALYNALEVRGWFWYAEHQKWQHETPQTSMFGGKDGVGAGVVRLRVMAHPSEITQAVDDITKQLAKNSWDVNEITLPYPNRRGPGMRVYVTLVMKGKKGKSK